MANYDVEFARAKAAGDTVEENGFGDALVRTLGPNTFKVGDMFRIPTDYKVFRNAEMTTDPENPVLYTFVEIMSSKTKATGHVRQLYPSMFQRTVYGYKKDEDSGEVVRDKEAEGVGYIVSGGKAVEEFQNHAGLKDAFDALAGKVIKVTDVRTIATRSFLSDAEKKAGKEYSIVDGKTFVLDFA